MRNKRDAMNTAKRSMLTCLAVSVAAMSLMPRAAHAQRWQDCTTVTSGQTWTVPKTTTLHCLDIQPGGNIAAPGGYSVSMTVDGVETGQTLTIASTGTDDSQFGVATQFVPGTYRGYIVLTVAQANTVSFALPGPPPTQYQYFPFRQALYLDANGVEAPYSVLSAVQGPAQSGFNLRNIQIYSDGQDFNGIYAAGGTWNVENAQIAFDGDGRSDFVGYGAAIEANSPSAKLVVDGASVYTHGVVRTAVVADGGSTVVVKNSSLYTTEGVLPAGYVETVNQAYMMSVPWMLGINGQDNVRATNLLGPSSIAAYISSFIGSDSWGTLSTDSGSDCTLVGINSRIENRDGYGSYIIGNATEYFLGDEFDVGGYVSINTGGTVTYGDSTPEAVAALNTSLSLGLSAEELRRLRPRPTHIESKRFGVMWHSSSGNVNVTGGTIFNTAQDTFLDKSSQAVTITVDGSQGARLNPANGILMQVMDDDDPGPQGPDMMNTGVYVEPTAAPVKDSTFDVTSTTNAAAAVFSNIALKGSFYNSSGWTLMAGGGGFGPPAGKQNMALTFNNSTIVGVITSSAARHTPCSSPCTIDAAQYFELGEVANTPSAAINNGAIVTLNSGSAWTVTGTSYLTVLNIAEGASVLAHRGRSVSMTVNGTPTPIVPGTNYVGAIVLTID
jgi:hypothetical protein